MNSFQLIITYLKFSILFVFEYPFYIDCLFTIYAVALHLFERTCKLCKKDVEDEIHFVWYAEKRPCGKKTLWKKGLVEKRPCGKKA